MHAKGVVLAGGAIETARLLLNSTSAREPEGLGNGRDLVGRNLQGHVYPVAYGLFDETVHGSARAGVSGSRRRRGTTAMPALSAAACWPTISCNRR